MHNKAYILILNWNNWQDTVACLESVFKNSYPNYQVVVIDNASTDGSEEKILDWADKKSIAHVSYNRETAEEGGLFDKEKDLTQPSMVFIQTGSNLGYAGGNNLGMGEDCELLVKIHPLERSSWLRSFIQELQKTYPFLRIVDTNIQALLCASDICVCGYSTAVLEAMFFNTPSIIFAPRPHPEHIPFVSMGAALDASR